MKPRVYAIVLGGTTAETVTLSEPMAALEIIPDGNVTIEAQLGDGQDVITLQSGAAYCTPSTVTVVDPMRLTVNAGAATTLSVIAWPR